jgi:hypothetical protein
MSAEKPKTGIILAVIFGIFGIMCACLAMTATDKYRTQKARVKRLEQKLAAGKQEVIKVPTLQLQAMDALEKKKMMGWDLEEVTEERDELSSECDELKTEVQTLKIGEIFYGAEKATLLKTIDVLRGKLSQAGTVTESKALLDELKVVKASKAAAEKSIVELEAILAERGPAMEEVVHAAPVLVSGDLKRVQRLLAGTEKDKARLVKKLKLLEIKNEKLSKELGTLKEALVATQERSKTEEETKAEQIASNLKKVIETASGELLPSLKEALTDLRRKVVSPYTAESDLLNAFKETETRFASIESALTPKKQ